MRQVWFSSEKKLSVVLFSLIVISMLLAALAAGMLRERPESYIVLRVDDIQDYAFRDTQLFLLNYSVEADLTMSLGVISGMFGEDQQVLEATLSAVKSGSEVGIHGWYHEDLAGLTLSEQRDILFEAKNRIRQLLGVDSTLLIPPMFSFNLDTISAMQKESCSIISTCTDYDEPIFNAEVINIPATVELSILSGNTWCLKSADVVLWEVEKSFELYGYAAIVTHPQEFFKDGKLDQTAAISLIALIEKLRETYNFTTFENIARQKTAF